MPDVSENNVVVSYFVPFHAAQKNLKRADYTLANSEKLLAVGACFKHFK